MPDLPNSIRRRMAAQQHAGEHPDADLLTAFAEGALSERERRSVVAHLAVCGECREVVAIITPAEGPPVSVPEPRRWWTLPALRWATVAVAAVVVIAAVMLHRPEPTRVMRSDAESAPSATVEAEKQQAPASVPKQPEPPGEADVAKREPPAPAPRQQAAQSRAFDELRNKEQVVAGEPAPLHRPRANEMAADRAAAAPPPPQAVAPAPPTVGGNLAGAVLAEKKSAPARAAAQPATTATSSFAMHDTAESAPMKTKQAESASATGQTAEAAPRMRRAEVLNAPNASGMLMAKRALVPEVCPSAPERECRMDAVDRSADWRVSTDGRLQQRQADGTWGVVNVGSPARFRAVIAMANEVWAGGDGGALYHSMDGGITWIREHATDEDIVRIGNATCRVSIETSSGQRLTRLRQAAGASWCSNPAGKP